MQADMQDAIESTSVIDGKRTMSRHPCTQVFSALMMKGAARRLSASASLDQCRQMQLDVLAVLEAGRDRRWPLPLLRQLCMALATSILPCADTLEQSLSHLIAGGVVPTACALMVLEYLASEVGGMMQLVRPGTKCGG
jgi:hypothetical protein